MHQALVVTDLTFGDAGKGSVTDALVRRGAGMVVRYNGGAQAAHTVIEPTGRCHVFHQFGSGTLVEGAQTFLSRYVLVNPLALYAEDEELRKVGICDAFERMHIDARALVTTPYHVIANRLRELARAANRHGSCGLGIGETASDALEHESQVLRFGDLAREAVLRHKLAWHRDHKRRQIEGLTERLSQLSQSIRDEKVSPLLDQLHSEEEMDAACEVFSFIASQVKIEDANFLEKRMLDKGCTVFEGAQGVLLDEDFGFHPHTTWSKTTSANALALIEETGADVQTTVLGLTRAYGTRHGAGPFPTEDESLTQTLREPHNPANQWQGPFRAGWLDIPLLRYAIRANRGVDGLIITCLDRLEEVGQPQVAVEYILGSCPWKPDPQFVSLGQREVEGHSLREVKVSYRPFPSAPTAYSLAVSDLINVPLVGTSLGPCANDKTFLF